MTNATVTEPVDADALLDVVDTHLRRATDRVSELLASVELERSTISKEMLADAVRGHASAILQSIWQARWSMPIAVDDDPQAMTVANWPEPKDETE